MIGDDNKKDDNPSKLHWWGGALSGGATVPYSWATGGTKAAKKGIEGALIGGLVSTASSMTMRTKIDLKRSKP